MKRHLYNKLASWKSDKYRKPLLIQGAKQVGKTYLISEFGRNEYTNFIYLNFEQDLELLELFNGDLNPSNLINTLSLYLGKKIESKNTLIFFDEIQIVPRAITSLKYFYEQANEFHIIAAGSLLGVSVGKTSSFPVGKVSFLTLRPMSFYEFLIATSDDGVCEMLKSFNINKLIPEIIHNKLIKIYKLYLYIGGMPEVVKAYIETKDIELVRDLQVSILEAYKKDFSKYAEKSQSIKTAELWNSIPNQLAKENKKFKYSDVRKKARAVTFENTIEWLKSAGLINIAYNVSKPELPLSGYADFSKFKIYLLDTGLLGAMLNLTSNIIINPDDIFKKYNGAFIENFVAQELILQKNTELYYWTSKGIAEVDFLLQIDDNILPLEVKSGIGLNMKSLNSYVAKYNPVKFYRTSPRNFIKKEKFANIPLYAIQRIFTI